MSQFWSILGRPITGTSKMAEQLNTHTWNIWSVLHSEEIHPFKFTSVQGREAESQFGE